MNKDDLKQQLSDTSKRGQELINEQLRLEGEYRALLAIVNRLEAEEPQPSSSIESQDVPVKVATDEGTDNAEATPAE